MYLCIWLFLIMTRGPRRLHRNHLLPVIWPMIRDISASSGNIVKQDSESGMESCHSDSDFAYDDTASSSEDEVLIAHRRDSSVKDSDDANLNLVYDVECDSDLGVGDTVGVECSVADENESTTEMVYAVEPVGEPDIHKPDCALVENDDINTEVSSK